MVTYNSINWIGTSSRLPIAILIVVTCCGLILSAELFVYCRLTRWLCMTNRAVQCSDMIVVSSSSVICQTTGPKPLPKQFLHTVRSRASSFNSHYPLLSLRSSSNFLRLLPRLPVTSICPFIFPSITCFIRQFLRKMWPIQLAFRFLISSRIFLCSLTLSNTSSFLTRSAQLIFSILLQHHISKLSRCFWSAARSVQVSAPYRAMLQT